MIRRILRDRRILASLALILIVAGVLVTWRTATAVATMLPWEGGGVVAGKTQNGRIVTLHLRDDGELGVIGIASRIDVGDEVRKTAGEVAYVVNGRRVNPLGTIFGSLLFFWLFLPIIALMPIFIIVQTREG